MDALPLLTQFASWLHCHDATPKPRNRNDATSIDFRYFPYGRGSERFSLDFSLQANSPLKANRQDRPQIEWVWDQSPSFHMAISCHAALIT